MRETNQKFVSRFSYVYAKGGADAPDWDAVYEGEKRTYGFEMLDYGFEMLDYAAKPYTAGRERGGLNLQQAESLGCPLRATKASLCGK